MDRNRGTQEVCHFSPLCKLLRDLVDVHDLSTNIRLPALGNS
jgi:hypothetical protein